MICYLDTQVVVWLCQNQLKKLTSKAKTTIEDSELLVSPMVMLELEYLFEIERTRRQPQSLIDQLAAQIGVRVCDHSFPAIIHSAVMETWTRDPFDRVIVAHARSNRYAPLVSADKKIKANYPRTVW